LLVGLASGLTGCGDIETENESEEETADSIIPDDATWLDGNAYYAYDDSLAWDEAEAFCTELGGHLISINSKEEQSLTVKLAKETGKDNIWTGGYLDDDTWAWTDGSNFFSYTNWDTSQPDSYDGVEAYIRFTSSDIYYEETNWTANEGKWNDIALSGDSDAPLSSFGFICEWQDATRLL